MINVIFIAGKTLYRRNYSPLKNLPGPNSNNWLYGHMFEIFDEPLAAPVTTWINERLYPQGLMHVFGLFGTSYIFPTSPQALAEVLSVRAYDYVKPTGFKRYTLRFWGHGIVSQEQEEHKQHRKTYLPVFNQQNIDRLKGMLSTKSMQLFNHIAELCTKEQSHDSSSECAEVVNITETIAKVSLDVTGIISLGVDFETILGNHKEVFHAHEMLFTSTNEKKFLFLLYNIAPQWLLNILPSQVARRLDNAHETLVKVCRTVIRERLTQLGKNEPQVLDFLTNLVETGSFSEDAAIAQIVVILGAGYESTGGTLAWAIYCVAKHHDIQVKLRQELTDSRNRHGKIDEKDYDKLPLLNAVVMEATRLYPAFSLLLRKAMRETTINGQIIPRGTYVGLCPHAINYAQHLWGPDADKFNPDRWIKACCVGRALALAQMKRQLATLVERYHLDRVDEKYDPRPSGLFATSPPHDLQIKFTKLSA
ncbi:cytochrome P450 [Aspergillus ambiguus]|uniref:cytochrome P450 n=1 Tax=Aspergillus ambiguus TaxID=176160 RepID=UPI003CCD3AD9